MSEKTILIADDDVQIVNALTLRCRRLGLKVTTAYDAYSTLTSVHDHKPDLVCVDVEMPAGSGLSVCEMLAADPGWRTIPVIVLTGKTDPATIRRCHEMCVFYVLKGTDLWSRVEPLVHELLEIEPRDIKPPVNSAMKRYVYRAKTNVALLSRRMIDGVLSKFGRFWCASSRTATAQLSTGEEISKLDSPPRVLLIDDDEEFTRALQHWLENHGVAVVRAFDGRDGCEAAVSFPADVILLDYEMPCGRGDDALKQLKGNPLTQKIPVIILTGRKDRMLEQKMFGLGAAKYLTKPFNVKDLLSALRQHIDVLEESVKQYSPSHVT